MQQATTISDGHSGAVHRYFFDSGISSAAAFFRHQRKAAALQRCFLRKFSAAAATANKLLPRLFRFKFLSATVWSLHFFSLCSCYQINFVQQNKQGCLCDWSVANASERMLSSRAGLWRRSSRPTKLLQRQSRFTRKFIRKSFRY